MSRKLKKKICLILSLIICLQGFFAWGETVLADQVSVSGSFNYDAARQMLDLVNQARAAAGLAPLAYDYNLEDYAKQRAAELTVLNSHVRPDGTNVPYSENYSIGWPTASAAHTAFVNSSSHYANIIGGYTTMAGACFVSGGQTYWVQVYSTNASGGAPNGLSGVQAETRTVNAQGTAAAAPQYADLDDSITVKVGAYIVVNAGVNGQMTSGTWSSDQPGIASVDGSGKITGVSPGVCLITGDFGVTAVRIQVTVITTGAAAVAPPPPPAAPAVNESPQAEAPAQPEEPVSADNSASAEAELPATGDNDYAGQVSPAEPGDESAEPEKEPSKAQASTAKKTQAKTTPSTARRTETTTSEKLTEPSKTETATTRAQKSFLAADSMSNTTRSILIIASIAGIVVASSLIVVVARSRH